ncbi:subtilisin-like protease SBT1.3 [Zingiber officinale]|uniref:Uncharacterized protein n=1 Tax=Zingiber officinale TaxID=94328 RepID=A0A8J5FBY2_ZINOF|nr:subtilisin-like protease SBT1.3 [Zingiber officinale]KAG6483898.1 hypothetical protein ZIOFF_060684 [Zingiber officinale]
MAAAAGLACLLSFLLALSPCSSSPPPRSTYIVHVAGSHKPRAFATHFEWYASAINSVTASTLDEPDGNRIVYSYDTAFHGFAATLGESEAELLGRVPGVLAVLPETVYDLHTTRSPEFLGIGPEVISNGVWSSGLADHDVVVGVLDTGIWPENPSFADAALPPVPARWKGACEVGGNFTRSHCNKKIVGARVFYQGYEASAGSIDEKAEFKSPRDQDGHGTHTAATVAGSSVPGASLFGYAQGTARGMAPRARVAVYKVCWSGGCFSSDILAAVDRAVADGVDVLSISLGGGVSGYQRDSLSIAAFGAMEKGVFVACSAGNAGPEPISLTNVSPWIATVGASTMDRDFPASVKLGSGVEFSGVSLYGRRQNLSPSLTYPLVFLGGGNSSSLDSRSLCIEGSLDPLVVAGKIVLCHRGVSPRVQKGQVVKDAGGVGMILANTVVNGEELIADSHLLPAVAVGQKTGEAIKNYIRTAARPTASLTFQGTKVGIRPSPVVAAFSSRGPNILTLEVLKPDMVAPGVNILAAWSGVASPTSLAVDRRRVGFNILSGTSMSCPHVGGVAALLKAKHPEWSPAAIKSALMTTAYLHDNTYAPLKDSSTGEPSTSYDHGAGHIQPAKAVDPGLVYDITADDYFEFLCTQNLTPLQLRVFNKHRPDRRCRHALSSAGDLNYPAISGVFRRRPAGTLTLRRVVTNVGPATSTYNAKVTAFKGADVNVEPETLRFQRRNQKLSFKISFRTTSPQPSPEFGALTWSDGVHKVRSPIALIWLQ